MNFIRVNRIPRWMHDFALSITRKSVRSLTFTGMCLVITLALSTVAAQSFVHPGILHSEADLNRLKTKSASSEEPWKSGFIFFKADKLSDLSYTMQGPFTAVQRGSQQDSLQLAAFQQDNTAAYQLSLMWAITNNQAYAIKAISILNAYATSLVSLGGVDAVLLAGSEGWKYAAAGEILRWHNDPSGMGIASGWTPAGISNCRNMLRNIFLPIVDLNTPPLSAKDGSAGIMCMKSLIAIGVFCEDTAVYNSALNAFLNANSCPQRIGVTGYILPNGQTAETNRDPFYAQRGLGSLAEVAETALIQGTDLYSVGNNRLLTAFEYAANLYDNMNVLPFPPGLVPFSLCSVPAADPAYNLPKENTPRIYEMVYNHYVNRKGLTAFYTKNFIQARLFPETGPANGHEEYPGWGTFLFYSGPAITYVPRFADSIYLIKQPNQFYYPVGIANGSRGAGAKVNIPTPAIIPPDESQPRYKFIFTHMGLGLYSIVNVRSGLAVQPVGGSIQPNVNLIQVPYTGKPEQLWRFVRPNAAADQFANVIFNYNSLLGMGGTVDVFQIPVGNSMRVLLTGRSIGYITLPPIPFKNVNSRDFDPAATTEAFLPITYTSSDTTVATIVNNKVHVLKLGSTTITASQPGNRYYFSSSDSKTLFVIPPPQANLFISDDFESPSATATGRVPQISLVPGRMFQATNTGNTATNSVAGGVARLYGNLGEVVSLASEGSYTKMVPLNITTTFRMGTLANEIPAIPGRGVYVGFFSAVPAAGSGIASFQNMRGIFINPENGALHLWNGSNSASATPLQSQPYKGTWAGGSQLHTLSFTVLGTIIECIFDGAAYTWQTTSNFNFTDVNFAGFGVSGTAADQYAEFENIRVSRRDQQTISFKPIPYQPLMTDDFDPAATASSDLIVTYTSSNPAVATIVAGKVHPVGLGTTVITANQQGDSIYLPAPAVSQTLQIRDALALPVVLSSYTARLIGNRTIQVSWTTEQEFNNDYFVVERSTDNLNFVAAGRVSSLGDGAHVYQFQDLHPATGYNYYRLKQIDKDGTTKIFEVKVIQLPLSASWQNVFPNPVRAGQSIFLKTGNTALQEVRINVYNAAGSKVIELRAGRTTAGELIEVKLGKQLAPGLYTVQLNGTYSASVMVEK